MSRQVSDSFGEKSESRRIVGKIDSIFVIKIWAIKELRLIYEQNFQAGFSLKSPDVPSHLSRAEREAQGRTGALHSGKFLPDALVERDYQGHVMVERGQAPGEGADHVRKAAGFAIRMGFAAREKDSHLPRKSPFCKGAAPM